MMQCVEYPDARLSRRIQDLQHMRNTVVGFSDTLQTIPYFAALGNEIVIWIDHQKRSDLLLICHVAHTLRSFSLAGDELLPAVDVVGRAREGRVGHDVYG
jgi:hypothetical protein